MTAASLTPLRNVTTPSPMLGRLGFGVLYGLASLLAVAAPLVYSDPNESESGFSVVLAGALVLVVTWVVSLRRGWGARAWAAALAWPVVLLACKFWGDSIPVIDHTYVYPCGGGMILWLLFLVFVAPPLAVGTSFFFASMVDEIGPTTRRWAVRTLPPLALFVTALGALGTVGGFVFRSVRADSGVPFEATHVIGTVAFDPPGGEGPQSVRIEGARLQRSCSPVRTGGPEVQCTVRLLPTGDTPEPTPSEVLENEHPPEWPWFGVDRNRFDVASYERAHLYLVRPSADPLSRDWLAFAQTTFAPVPYVARADLRVRFAPSLASVVAGAAASVLAGVLLRRAKRAGERRRRIEQGTSAVLDGDGNVHFDDGGAPVHVGLAEGLVPGPMLVVGAPARAVSYRSAPSLDRATLFCGTRAALTEAADTDRVRAAAMALVSMALLATPLFKALFF